MCLSYAEQIWIDPQDEDWKIGYKVLTDRISPIFDYRFKLGINVDEKISFIGIYDAETLRMQNAYLTGFHLFTSKKDALAYKNYITFYERYYVRKVRYRKVTAIGKQDCHAIYIDCVVAREIDILKL